MYLREVWVIANLQKYMKHAPDKERKSVNQVAISLCVESYDPNEGLN